MKLPEGPNAAVYNAEQAKRLDELETRVDTLLLMIGRIINVLDTDDPKIMQYRQLFRLWLMTDEVKKGLPDEIKDIMTPPEELK